MNVEQKSWKMANQKYKNIAHHNGCKVTLCAVGIAAGVVVVVGNPEAAVAVVVVVVVAVAFWQGQEGCFIGSSQNSCSH